MHHKRLYYNSENDCWAKKRRCGADAEVFDEVDFETGLSCAPPHVGNSSHSSPPPPLLGFDDDSDDEFLPCLSTPPETTPNAERNGGCSYHQHT